MEAPRDALAFEHIFILRLDMALTRSNLTCLFSQDGPMTHRTNTDQFTYLPGRYLCGNQIFIYGAFVLNLASSSTPSTRRLLDGVDAGSSCTRHTG